jgi:hypothetical protein
MKKYKNAQPLLVQCQVKLNSASIVQGTTSGQIDVLLYNVKLKLTLLYNVEVKLTRYFTMLSSN